MPKVVLINLYGILFKNLYSKWLSDNEEALKAWLDSNQNNAALFNFSTNLGKKISLSKDFPNYFKQLIFNNEQKNIGEENFYSILKSAAESSDKQDMYQLIHAKDEVLNLDIVDFIEKEKLAKSRVGLVSNANREIVEECLEYKYDKINNKSISQLFSEVFLAEDLSYNLSDLEFFKVICKKLECELKELYFISHNSRNSDQLAVSGINIIFYDEDNRFLL